MKQTRVFFMGGNYRLNGGQRDNFMEKKIKRTGKKTESGSGINEEKVIIATVLVAIVIMSGVLVWEIIANPPTPEPFFAMYVLDSEKQANNYPTTVVLGTNSTFSLWVGVENQKDKTMDYSVQVKLDDGTSTHEPSPVEPMQVFNRTLVDGETWEFEVTINIDQPGNNRIIFELQFFNAQENRWEYAWIRLDFTVEAIQP
ncbi:MAG: hypothetical protein CW716_11410 [Candidatus Bathyarchaeum sp.]|nr:MAG: hypothetical protein CW716_11410 [Candidatus Bathyarchaeum sp.]